LAASVTLTPIHGPHGVELWRADSVVEIEDERVEYSTDGHLTERAALLVLANWLRIRFGAVSTHLESGSRITLVGISAAA
jgi:hypothetical protein